VKTYEQLVDASFLEIVGVFVQNALYLDRQVGLEICDVVVKARGHASVPVEERHRYRVVKTLARCSMWWCIMLRKACVVSLCALSRVDGLSHVAVMSDI
jgi:hypothetical protein